MFAAAAVAGCGAASQPAGVADAAAADVDSRQPDAEGTFNPPDGPPMDAPPPDGRSFDAALLDAPLPDGPLPDAAGPPPSPTGLRACAADSQVTLAFDTVPGATSYDLYVGSAPGVTPQSMQIHRCQRWPQ
jgi:hypothetical protein